MNKLTKTRFTALLLINDIFALFCLTGDISLMTVWGFTAGTALQMILSFPAAFSVRNGKSTEKCGKPTQIFFIVYLILWGGMIFSMLWNTSEVIYIPYENSGLWGKIAVSAALGAVCLYMTAAGMKTLVRSSLIASAAGMVCIVIVVVSSLKSYNFDNLRLVGSGNFLTELARGISLSGGLGSFVVLLGNTNGNPVINSVIYFSAKIIITAVIILTSILLSGGIMDITDFPIVISAHLSQPFPSQRIDSLFLIIFSVFGAFSAATQLALAVYLVKTISDAEKYISIIILSFSILSAFIFQRNAHQGLISAVIVLSALLVPVFSFSRKKHKKVLTVSVLMMIMFTGCNSAGQVYKRNYLRSISFDGDNIIMTFFNDDLIKLNSEIKNARQSAEEITGREIFTGHTELIVLNDCDEINILSVLLNDWKVSPDCTVIFGSGDILEKKDTDDITGAVKILEKEKKTAKSDIISTLSRLINQVHQGNSDIPLRYDRKKDFQD